MTVQEFHRISFTLYLNPHPLHIRHVQQTCGMIKACEWPLSLKKWLVSSVDLTSRKRLKDQDSTADLTAVDQGHFRVQRELRLIRMVKQTEGHKALIPSVSEE